MHVHAPASHRDEPRFLPWLLALSVLGFGALAVALGQSNNWDLRNYHLYNGWAWLTGRGARDLAVAHAQTWFNPLLPAGLYLLLSATPAWLGTFVLGCAQGLNLIPLLAIARRLLPRDLQQTRYWLVPLVVLTGCLGATGLGELGASFGDTLVSLPLLGAIALLLARDALGTARLFVAGALLGTAVGLKLTAAPIALGIALALPWLAPSPREALRFIGVCGSAALLAFAVCDGWWMWRLWHEYNNPLFPMFGNLFGGDYAPPIELRDARYLPHGLISTWLYPLVWAQRPRLVSELWFLDLRIPLLFIAMLAMPLWARLAATQSPSRALRFLLLALALGYVAWQGLFGYYRYLAVLEMLAPIVLACALAALPARSPRRATFAIGLLCALLVATTKPPNWGRIAHGKRYVDIQLPALANLASATVLLVDSEPLAFVAPAFPASTNFVRIGGSLLGPPLPAWRLDADAAVRIAAAGALYVLLADPRAASTGQVLARHRLRLDAAGCVTVTANLLPPATTVYLCTVRKGPGASPDIAP